MAEKNRRRLLADYIRMRLGSKPSEESKTHMTDKDNSLVGKIEDSQGDFLSYSYNKLAQLRSLATDRCGQYNAYDEISNDSTIATALELYSDDATQSDEQGRVIWIESEVPEIVKAGNRLLDIMEIPERAWSHIYKACKYGDFYLKLYRDFNDEDEALKMNPGKSVHIINDEKKMTNSYQEYVEDVRDPATIFELRVRGKTAGFVELPVDRNVSASNLLSGVTSYTMSANEIKIYPPDRFVHVLLSDNPSRDQEEMTIEFDPETSVTYQVARGKSALADVYGIQKQLTLLEDTLALTRLVKSPLIRLLEIEVGDMPKNEVNPYLRRFKQLIENHISMDKEKGNYQSYAAPGPIDNLILVPVKNGKGASTVNTLGGDVNIRDIADIEYYSKKRSGALKIPRAYLGDDMDGSGLSNGGSLTRQSIQYARTIKRIQRAYIRAITQLLNLFWIDKGLDYIGKFEVKMTSPSTQEDLERNELIGNNVDLISGIMDLTDSLEGSTQKKILNHLVSNVLKMPEIAEIIEKDETPSDEINIEGSGVGGSSVDIDISSPPPSNSPDITDASSVFGGESGGNKGEEGFTDQEYSDFQDEM